jgi:hypothetical protein
VRREVKVKVKVKNKQPATSNQQPAFAKASAGKASNKQQFEY